MGKYPIYAILAIVFIGIIKLLQVTAFDSEQYAKNKESSFSQSNEKKETPYEKANKSGDSQVKKQEQPAEETPNDSLTTSSEQTTEDTNTFESEATNTETPSNEGSEASNDDTFGNSPTDESSATYTGFEDLKELYLAPKIADLTPGQRREDVVIRYYRHDKDGEKVYSLNDLGYYIHEKEATETAGLGSNVMYYGSEVNVEDIQIVAYALLEEGVPLKAVLPTQFSWKSKSIEIGTDTLLLNNSNLTELDIQSFQK